MAILQVTSHLKNIAPKHPASVEGRTLHEVLEKLFAQYPLLRGYILDDRGLIRKHVAIFIEGERISNLNCPLSENTKVYVLQALSGG